MAALAAWSMAWTSVNATAGGGVGVGTGDDANEARLYAYVGRSCACAVGGGDKAAVVVAVDSGRVAGVGASSAE